MTDHSMMKLGRKPARFDPRTLRLAKYLTGALPPIPPAYQWSAKVPPPWGMMENDRLGDCTCAAAGHAIQTWTANSTTETTPPDSAIEAAYEDVGGYVPGQPNTDNGCCEIDVLNYWRKTGIGGHNIGAYVSIDPQNLAHVQAACVLFGGLYIGVALPLTAQTQDVWDVTDPFVPLQGDAAPGSWGGHAVFVPDYDAAGMTCVTWGALKRMTAAWWLAYCEECYAIISPDFLNQGISPQGFNLALLQQDLQQVSY